MDNRLIDILCDPGDTMNSLSTEISGYSTESHPINSTSIALPTSFQLSFDLDEYDQAEFTSSHNNDRSLPSILPLEQDEAREDMNRMSGMPGMPGMPSSPTISIAIPSDPLFK